MITIAKFTEVDRARWEELFRLYLEFYQRPTPPALMARAWGEFQAEARMHARGAWLDGKLVGIAQFLVHASTSTDDMCYLQDLFTAPEARGQGVAAALIAAVAEWARAQRCYRVYWMTHESNATARRLYDKVADNRGFIRYQIELT